MSDDWDVRRLDMVDFLRRILLTAEEARKEDFDLLLAGMPRASYFVREKVVTVVQDNDGYLMEVRDPRRSSGIPPVTFRYNEEGEYSSCERGEAPPQILEKTPTDLGSLDIFEDEDTTVRVEIKPRSNEVEADDWLLATRQEGVPLDEE